ncbi:MAG: hypothetical protein HY366_01325 [Candidatus Aenigmarchaeota archaeon]|nr:hypothetical protein [Candidatus Aenigmarchaeota archaeon]
MPLHGPLNSEELRKADRYVVWKNGKPYLPDGVSPSALKRPRTNEELECELLDMGFSDIRFLLD